MWGRVSKTRTKKSPCCGARAGARSETEPWWGVLSGSGQREDRVVDFVIGGIYRNHYIGASPGTEDHKGAIREQAKRVHRLSGTADASIRGATDGHIHCAKHQMSDRSQSVTSDSQRNATMRVRTRVEMDFVIDIGARKVVILHIGRYNRAVGGCRVIARADTCSGDKDQREDEQGSKQASAKTLWGEMWHGEFLCYTTVYTQNDT